jgi:hypothetical protein
MPSDTSRALPRAFSSVLLAALLVGACGTSGGSAIPSSGPVNGPIEHTTGSSEVILRMEQGGGLVPIDFLASQAPTFTLYGNGMVVFQPKLAAFPTPDAKGVIRHPAWRTARLNEGQVQSLLAFAIEESGLGTARPRYTDDHIADASSTIFTLAAGGLTKTVDIYALSEALNRGPDAGARAAFLKLANRLVDFDQGGSIPTDAYAPNAWRAVLIERQGGDQAPMAWPWPNLTLADFPVGPDGSGPTRLPHRSITAAEVALLNLGSIPGGAQNVAVRSPTSKDYTLVLRPLLPDERA